MFLSPFFFSTPWLPRLFCYKPLLPPASILYLHHTPHYSPFYSQCHLTSHPHLPDWPANPSSHTTLIPFLSRYSSLTSRPLKMKAVGSLEASLLQHHSPEEQWPEPHHHEISDSQVWDTFAAAAHDSLMKSVEAVTYRSQKCWGLCGYLVLNVCHLT